MDACNVTRKMITDGLRGLGLLEGNIVLVHSSLSSFGHVEGGAGAVIDALWDAVGPAGLLCFPTLSYGKFGPDNPPPPFDPAATRCIVGQIPETFRLRPGVIRSLHPTHSIAAYGPRAGEFLAGHEDSETPCGPNSPWRRLCDCRGSVLMIGCGTGPMTLSHGPEEVLHKETRCTPPVRCQIKSPDGWIERMLRLHGPYQRPGPDRTHLESAAEERGALRRTKIGNSVMLLIGASAVWEIMSEWCKQYAGVRPTAP
jgi:aminoglycoside 3-N-acetyltransferase